MVTPQCPHWALAAAASRLPDVPMSGASTMRCVRPIAGTQTFVCPHTPPPPTPLPRPRRPNTQHNPGPDRPPQSPWRSVAANPNLRCRSRRRAAPWQHQSSELRLLSRAKQPNPDVDEVLVESEWMGLPRFGFSGVVATVPLRSVADSSGRAMHRLADLGRRTTCEDARWLVHGLGNDLGPSPMGTSSRGCAAGMQPSPSSLFVWWCTGLRTGSSLRAPERVWWGLV